MGQRVTRPDHAAFMREKWKDPEYRASVTANRQKWLDEHPGVQKLTKLGVPHGMKRKEARKRWTIARKKARKWIEIMEDQGHLPKVTIPGSNEEKAKAVLEEMATICLGPLTESKLKVAAGRVVLEWTMSKPAAKQEVAISNAEAWLNEVIKDNDSRREEGGS